MNKIGSIVFGGVFALFMPVTTASAATMSPIVVDTELALLIDVSGSVDANEFTLQRQGYIDAFNSQAVKDAISSGTNGKIAATVVYWSSAGSQNQIIDWFLIDSDAASTNFATAISNAARPFSGSTAPGSAIDFIVNSSSANTFATNEFDGVRNVIDVSGDGASNQGISTSGARDNALDNDVDAINGIVIGGGASVFNFYRDNVVGGDNSFLLQANSFLDFGAAVQTKLVAEITGVTPDVNVIPLPAAGWMLLAGIGGLAAMRRRKDKAAA